MKIISFVSTIVLIVTTTGCSWLGFRDRTNDYLLANEIKPTVIPENLNPIALGQLYPVSAISEDNKVKQSTEVPRPQPISENTFEQLVKIQKINEHSWILVNSSPSQLWPRIRSILNRSGIPTARAEGAAGIIETIWLSYNSDEDNEHRFLFSITPGVQLNSTEISIVHQQRNKGDENSIPWPQASEDITKENDMLMLIANELAAQPDYASVSLLAQDIGGDSKVDLITPEISDPYILIRLSFARTWVSVDYSANRGGFTIIDKDRSKGLFLVNYIDEIKDENSGIFSSLFTKDSNQEILKITYHILVQDVGTNVEVRLVSPNGESLDKNLALKLLNILRTNMT